MFAVEDLVTCTWQLLSGNIALFATEPWQGFKKTWAMGKNRGDIPSGYLT